MVLATKQSKVHDAVNRNHVVLNMTANRNNRLNRSYIIKEMKRMQVLQFAAFVLS